MTQTLTENKKTIAKSKTITQMVGCIDIRVNSDGGKTLLPYTCRCRRLTVINFTDRRVEYIVSNMNKCFTYETTDQL